MVINYGIRVSNLLLFPYSFPVVPIPSCHAITIEQRRSCICIMQSDSSPVDKNAQQRHEERVAQAKSIIREVQTLYDAGAPLFTKDAIRKLGDELSIFQQGASSGHQITLRGINGVDYSTFIDCPPVEYEPGKRYHIGGSTWYANSEFSLSLLFVSVLS